MRINVYAEEIILETEVVRKVVTNDRIGTRTFYGVRMYLDSPESLHRDSVDDDRSAITFWIPWTKAGGYNTHLLQRLFSAMEMDTYAIEAEISRDIEEAAKAEGVVVVVSE